MKILYLISAILLISCNSKDNKSNESNPNSNIDSLSTLKEKSHGTKLFLDFQYNMSMSEYLECVDNLILKKKVSREGSNVYYSTNNCNVLIEPIIVDNQLKKIQLKGIECIYPFYVEKYNLPPMILKKLIQDYTENNPDYNPVSQYTNSRNEIVILTSAFIDKTNKLNPGQIITNENNEMTKILPKDKFEIVKDSVTIVFQQEFTENPLARICNPCPITRPDFVAIKK